MKKALNVLRFAAFSLLVFSMYWLLCKYFFLNGSLVAVFPDELLPQAARVLTTLLTIIIGSVVVGTIGLLVGRLNPYGREGRFVTALAFIISTAYAVYQMRLTGQYFNESGRYYAGAACLFIAFLTLGAKAAHMLNRQRYA